eukprot:6207538-Pleurochrysis_carterae.AAC.1
MQHKGLTYELLVHEGRCSETWWCDGDDDARGMWRCSATPARWIGEGGGVSPHRSETKLTVAHVNFERYNSDKIYVTSSRSARGRASPAPSNPAVPAAPAALRRGLLLQPLPPPPLPRT